MKYLNCKFENEKRKKERKKEAAKLVVVESLQDFTACVLSRLKIEPFYYSFGARCCLVDSAR